ncbi:MAG: DUF1735 and LamG domain-containing protein [Paramuribaculum sp.]|nr:DUF1735 and LamG domain-containing protein [Paramuribaculum sp.]
MKKSFNIAIALMVGAAGMFTACNENFEDVENRVYDEGIIPTTTMFLGQVDEATQTLSCRLASPATHDVYIKYGVNEDMVDVYNAANGTSAMVLPVENYEWIESTVVVEAGKINSSKAEIKFFNLDALDDTHMYVLPVLIEDSPLEVLENYRTVYYVFRAGAIINVAGNLTGTCLTFVNEGQTPELGGLQQFTFECMLYPYQFTNTLSTLMGIEGSSLFRIGDAGIPSNQLQIATGSGNTTDAAWKFDTNKWTFLTVTFDGTTGNVNVYFNGVKKGDTQKSSYRTFNWNVKSDDRACYIGYAYDTNRDFQGLMSQVRVWNKILTLEEINAKNHFYTVPADSEGLVFYAKFDEGSGSLVHDYANGYDMSTPATYPGKSNAPGKLGWQEVSLP